MNKVIPRRENYQSKTPAIKRKKTLLKFSGMKILGSGFFNHKDGRVHSSCFQIVEGVKIYYTHKSNIK